MTRPPPTEADAMTETIVSDAAREQLKSCPFCGGEADCAPSAFDDPLAEPEEDREVVSWGVGCSCTAFVGPWSTEAEAITAWNRRASLTPATDERAEAVREAAAKVASNPPHEFLPLRDPSEPIGADEMLKAEGFRDAQRIIAAAICALDLSTITTSAKDRSDG